MIAVRGLMALIVFDDGGKIEQVQRFGAEFHVVDPGVAAGTETRPGKWHTVVSLESGSILPEAKAGPFDPTAPKFPAPWAALEGSQRAWHIWTNSWLQLGPRSASSPTSRRDFGL